MKKYLSILAALLFLISSYGAVANHFETTTQFIDTIDLNIPEPTFSSFTTTEGSFTIIDMKDSGSTITTGKAELPVLYKFVEIPYGSQPQVTLTDSKWNDYSFSNLQLPERIKPVQHSQFKNEDKKTASLLIDQIYYSTNTYFNSDTVSIKETGIIRGHRFALVEIQPVQYNPVHGKVKVLESMEFEVSVLDAEFDRTEEKLERYYSEAFENQMKDLFINYDSFYHPTQPNQMATNHYLIISADAFSDSLNPLVDWKEGIGYDVTLTEISDIPGGATTTNIQNYIQDAYDSWSTPPGYVLLVGDTDTIPAFNGDSSNTATDLYYVTVDGTDYLPDIYIGRFPGSQTSHITAMVDKTVAYESGDWANNEFASKTAFMAGVDNYQVSEGTHNYVIDNYFDPNDFTYDKLYETTFGATTQDVRDSLNDGRVLACYSGHGSSTSWADGPPFSQGDVGALTNVGMLSFVCSHACVTGKYNIGECFGETWVRTPNKGAVVFWGSSANTLWDEDDVLEKKTLAEYFDYGPVAAMTDTGKIGVYAHYGGGGYTKYYFECYNIFGDPSLIVGFSWSGGGGGGGGGSGNFIPPRVGITRPASEEHVKGTIDITGYAYGIEGPVKYVFVKIDGGAWLKPVGLNDWSYTWDTTQHADGEVIIQAVSIDNHGHQSGVDVVVVNVSNEEEEEPPKYPDLSAQGTLNWADVTPGSIVEGTIMLRNVGDAESLLSWEVTDIPEDWGRWTINPSTGSDLTPEDGTVEIAISVEVPDEQEQNFSGAIRIENTENSNDYQIIQVNLATPLNRPQFSSIWDFVIHFLKENMFFQRIFG